MGHRRAPIPTVTDWSAGKLAFDMGNRRFLLCELDRTPYAVRCLDCGAADKIYQNKTHAPGCPEVDPQEGSFYYVCAGRHPLTPISKGFKTWGEADAEGARLNVVGSFVERIAENG
jgi:hypothetical protein